MGHHSVETCILEDIVNEDVDPNKGIIQCHNPQQKCITLIKQVVAKVAWNISYNLWSLFGLHVQFRRALELVALRDVL